MTSGWSWTPVLQIAAGILVAGLIAGVIAAIAR